MMQLVPAILVALVGHASAEEIPPRPAGPACAAAAMRHVCVPCSKGAGGTGGCTVLQKITMSGGDAVSQCCAKSQQAPACSFWTYNHGTHECIIKTQNPGAAWDHAANGTRCTSGFGPAPLPPPAPPRPPGPPPSPPSPPCPPRPPAPAPNPSRNLLYLVVDDLRSELGFTNHRKGLVTPVLDALAKKGMVFDRAYVQQGVCSPSRNSFLSGRRPDTTKIWNFKDSFRTNLGDCISSWPGAFKNAGFTSTGMGKVSAAPPSLSTHTRYSRCDRCTIQATQSRMTATSPGASTGSPTTTPLTTPTRSPTPLIPRSKTG